jgi:S1-C subfamily serine protease
MPQCTQPVAPLSGGLRRFVAALAALAAEAGPAVAMDVSPAVLAAEHRRIETIRRASDTAVAIFAGEAGGGSGVLVSPDGYALTNFHVVQPAGVAMQCGLADGRLYDAVLVGLAPRETSRSSSFSAATTFPGRSSPTATMSKSATSASRPATRSCWPPT